MSAATKCLRFKEPEVDDYVVYKYTESESTDEEGVEKTETELEEIKEETEEDVEATNKTLISENTIKSSIELLNIDGQNKKNNKVDNNKNDIKNDNTNDNKNENIDKDITMSSNQSLNNDEKDNDNKSDRSTDRKLYESMESFEVYKDGDSAIIEGIPQIEIKLNISRDNLLASQAVENNNSSNHGINNININNNNNNNNANNANSNEKNIDVNISSQSNENNLVNSNNKNSSDLNELNNENKKSNSKSSSRNSLYDSSNKINHRKENIKNILGKRSESSLIFRSTSSSLNVPRAEGNSRNQMSVADRSKERIEQSQKKMIQRKLMREKLRNQMNERREKKSAKEVSININNLENNNNEDNKNNRKIKLVLREKPLSKNTSLTNSDENSDTIVDTNPYVPQNRSKNSEIILKDDEDINKILKEIGETHFLVDDTNVNLENILNILGQTEIDTIDNTVGVEILETATHMKNFEHGAIFRLSSDNNYILKIIPFDPEKNDLDMNRNFEDNQVSLKTVLQEVMAMTVLSHLHITGEVSGIKDEENEIALDIEDEEINNEKKILAFARPEGMWICRGSINKAFNYEFQNYQLNEFNPNQYFLITLYNDEGEIVNSNSNLNRSFEQIKSILWQICYSLALAEESIGFEHRELYPECILVEEVPREELIYKINDREIVKDNFGVKAVILDYSRSRLEYCGKVYYSDLTGVIYDDPSKKKSLEDLKTTLDSTWYQTAPIVNRSSFADLIQSFAWIVECDKAMMNWLYNNMLEFAVRVEYNMKSMKEALSDPFWDLTKKNWEVCEKRKLSNDLNDTEGECLIL